MGSGIFIAFLHLVSVSWALTPAAKNTNKSETRIVFFMTLVLYVKGASYFPVIDIPDNAPFAYPVVSATDGSGLSSEPSYSMLRR